MVALEGDMPSDSAEEAAQHETQRLGIVGPSTTRNDPQSMAKLGSITFILEVLVLQPFDDLQALAQRAEALEISGKDTLLLKAMNAAQHRPE